MMRRLSALFVLAALSLFAAEDPQSTQDKTEGPVVNFRSDVSLKRFDVQVVDSSNRPIRGLEVQDFILRLNGKQQEIRNFQNEKMPVEVLLLLDVSRSMEPHVQRIASASHQALRALGDQDRVAIMVFDRASRIRMPFRASRRDAEQGLEQVLQQETFQGGTDITRGLLDAVDYMAQNGRRDARRAIVILTDDQTERDRNDPSVLRALARAETSLSALIAPDALHTGSSRSLLDDPRLRELFGGSIPREFGSIPMFGPRTRSAGTSNIARSSGGDSMSVDDASSFEDTLARIRQRYALYFYLPEGVQSAADTSIEVDLSDSARQHYPGAKIRQRRPYTPPPGSDDNRPVRVSLPLPVAA